MADADPVPNKPVPFGYKCQWLAIKTEDTKAVADAVFLRNAQPATWQEGIQWAYGSKLFVSPPVDGWSLVVGNCLPDAGRPDGPDWQPDRCTPLIVHLSKRFGEVQYFGTHRIAEYHAWMKACAGRILRACAYLGEQGVTIWNRGGLTPEENKLGFTSPRESSNAGEDTFTEIFPDEDFVMQIAGKWSINPQTLEGYGSNSTMGLVGDLGPAFFRVDRRKITYGEYWRMFPGLTVVKAWLVKLLGLGVESRSFAPIGSPLDFDYDYVPDYAKRLMDPFVRFAESRDQRVMLVRAVPTLDVAQSYEVDFLNGDGTIVTIIPFARAQFAYPPNESSCITFLSPLDGDNVLETSNVRSWLTPRDGEMLFAMTGSSAEETFARHVERVEENRSRLRRIPTTEVGFSDFLRELQRADEDHRCRRGLYVEMAQDEVNHVRGLE
jgi:hypothetical protein